MPHLDFDGMPGPVIFGRGTEAVAGLLSRVFRGWPLTSKVAPVHATAVLSVRRQGRDIRVERTADGWTSFEPSAVSAVCTLVVEMVAVFLRARANFGGLHAAAADFGGRLVLFPATHRVGKSTLMARLAAQGRRIFADDLLPVDLATCEAYATGCLPRLRVPLPARSSIGFRRFVEKNTVASDGYHAYLGAQTVAQHGERAPIGAIVLLEREDDRTMPGFERVEPEEAVLKLLVQDTNEGLDATYMLDRYLALAAGLPSLRLRFGEIEAAVDALEQRFREWDDPRPVDEVPAGMPLQSTRDGLPGQEKSAGPFYGRDPRIDLRVIGEKGFLAGGDRNGIHALNGLGLGLWNLLVEPLDADTIVGVFRGAFPDTDPDAIRLDVLLLIERMIEEGLIRVED